VLAVDLIAGDPAGRHPGVQRAGEHPDRQLGLGRERHVLGHCGLLAPWPVLGPGLGQVQLPVQERATGRAGIAQEHPDLAARPGPRCRSTAGPPRPIGCPSSKTRSRRPPAPPPDRPGAPPRSRVGRHRPGPGSSPPLPAAVASRPGWTHRPTRPASNRSCAPTAPASHADTPPPVLAALTARTATRSAHAPPQGPPPSPLPRPPQHDQPPHPDCAANEQHQDDTPQKIKLSTTVVLARLRLGPPRPVVGLAG